MKMISSGLAGKDDLFGACRADESGDSLPRLLIGGRRPLGQVIEPAKRVGVLGLIKAADRFDHTGRFLGRRGVVQVDQRGMISENREIISDIHYFRIYSFHRHSPSQSFSVRTCEWILSRTFSLIMGSGILPITESNLACASIRQAVSSLMPRVSI